MLPLILTYEYFEIKRLRLNTNDKQTDRDRETDRQTKSYEVVATCCHSLNALEWTEHMCMS